MAVLLTADDPGTPRPPAAPKKSATHQTVALPKDLVNRLKAVAADRKEPLAHFVANALGDWLRAHQR